MLSHSLKSITAPTYGSVCFRCFLRQPKNHFRWHAPRWQSTQTAIPQIETIDSTIPIGTQQLREQTADGTTTCFPDLPSEEQKPQKKFLGKTESFNGPAEEKETNLGNEKGVESKRNENGSKKKENKSPRSRRGKTKSTPKRTQSNKNDELMAAITKALDKYKPSLIEMKESTTKAKQTVEKSELAPLIQKMAKEISDLATSKLNVQKVAGSAKKEGRREKKETKKRNKKNTVEKARKKDIRDDDMLSIRPARRKASKIAAEETMGLQTLGTAFSKLNENQSIETAMKRPSTSESINTSTLESINASALDITPINVPRPPVPRLSYGLDRVLFNPGVCYLQDPRSRVYNFDPYLQNIMPVADFDFNSLKEYITSSKDETLRALAREHGKKYIGSSSSMTSALSHFHYLLSGWRPITAKMLSQSFTDPLRTFTALQRTPSAIFLRYKDGSYAIDADKEFDSANILMMLGKSLEKLLTLRREDYERYRRSSSEQISQEEKNAPEAFHYCTMGDFLMRSQLDAYDPRLPGSGMFDLKTRAVISIRMDVQNYEEGLGYEIKKSHGDYESFEREYFDMIRAAFLKYSLQVRMGRMDGIYVAFHNVERIFGFQYISLSEMDRSIHGTENTTLGDQEFRVSLRFLNQILDRITEKYPEQSVRIHFEARETKKTVMRIFAEPMTEEQIVAIQTKNAKHIEAFERSILGIGSNANESSDGDNSGDERINEVEKEEGMSLNNTSITVENLDMLDDTELPNQLEGEDEQEPDPQPQNDLLAFELTVNNKVNGNVVLRPDNLSQEDNWSIEYELKELPVGRETQKKYTMTQARRSLKLQLAAQNEQGGPISYYVKTLRDLAKQGREWRKQCDEMDAERAKVVLDLRTLNAKEASPE